MDHSGNNGRNSHIEQAASGLITPMAPRPTMKRTYASIYADYVAIRESRGHQAGLGRGRARDHKERNKQIP